MADSQLGWSDSQWQMVNNAVTEAFTKSSVASALLPCYGPLSASAEYVRAERLLDIRTMVSVQDNTTLRLFNLTVDVDLSSEQVADEGLASALLAFRRAANTVAQAEDDIVFNGVGRPRTVVDAFLPPRQPQFDLRGIVRPGSPDDARGLVFVDQPNRIVGRGTGPAHQIAESAIEFAEAIAYAPTAGAQPTPGDFLIGQIARAIVDLETAGHPGPFACVVGADVFVAMHTPAAGLVLPVDRFTPMLNGPLLRSGRMGANRGILVTLAANAIDIVVATPPKAQFLLVDNNARYRFRVYEKFILRIKDPGVVRGFTSDPTAAV